MILFYDSDTYRFYAGTNVCCNGFKQGQFGIQQLRLSLQWSLSSHILTYALRHFKYCNVYSFVVDKVKPFHPLNRIFTKPQ